MLQLRVTALFYLENNRKIHPWGVRSGRPKDAKRRERERTSAGWGETLQLFGSSFYMFFFLSLGLPYVNWASQECCLFYLRSSLWSSDPPLFCFRGLFPSLSFSHHHSGLLFPILTTEQNHLFSLPLCHKLWEPSPYLLILSSSCPAKSPWGPPECFLNEWLHI